jgi:hypothetical protein
VISIGKSGLFHTFGEIGAEALTNPLENKGEIACGQAQITKSAEEPKSEPVSIVRGEPPDLSSILVSPSEALF